MIEPNSFYIKIDVPTQYLLTCGAKITFDLSEKSCNGGDLNIAYRFLLVQVTQCNGAQISLPIVKFCQHATRVDMTIVSPLLQSNPQTALCGRSLLCIEYFK